MKERTDLVRVTVEVAGVRQVIVTNDAMAKALAENPRVRVIKVER